jgi:pantoate--beta-alanine ligase
VTVVHTATELSTMLDDARRAGATVGLVPTMGALHGGHRVLVETAAAECDVVAVSIFVNPLQFGDPDDLTRYPRDLDADIALVAEAGAAVVFAPSIEEMYPGFPVPPLTSVSVSGLGERWEGASRPGHFDGVATVVTKLFAMAGRCRSYFGEKDFQQLAVVRRLVTDLSLPVTVVGCPTARESDGLAMSSRNARLDRPGRQAATVLWRALREGQAVVRSGTAGSEAVAAAMTAVVASEPAVDLDYAVIVRADDLETPIDLVAHRAAGGEQRLLIAARVGAVRLIDNLDPWADSSPVDPRTTGPSGPERG